MKQVHSDGRLVALQMPDQMPSGQHIVQGSLLRFPLLHAVLAEVAESGVEGFADALRGNSLGNADNGDFVRTPPGPAGSAFDAPAESQHIFGYRVWGLEHGVNSNRVGAA